MNRTRLLTAAATVVAALAALAGPAHADTSQVDVSAGTSGIEVTPQVADFTGVTLNGTPQLTSAAMDTFVVDDFSGTAAGWNVTVAFSPLTNSAAVAPHDVLPANSVTMPVPVVRQNAGTVSPVPGTLTPATPSAGLDNVGGVKIVSAAAGGGEGMGSYLFSPSPIRLTVPSDAQAGTYISTVTVTFTNTP
jgi:hypothetical protein